MDLPEASFLASQEIVAFKEVVESFLAIFPEPYFQYLRIADVTLAVSCPPGMRLQNQDPLYRIFFANADHGNNNSRIGVRLVLGRMPDLSRLQKLFDTRESWTIYGSASGYWLSLHPTVHLQPFWIARFDRRANWAIVYCRSFLAGAGEKKHDLANPICYPLDQLLLMYFLAPRRGILTHAAGVVRGGRAMIFPGCSGAGKSTFSELLAAAKVGKLLSDERMIIREIDGTMRAFGTPWAGTAGIARNADAPLAGIYFLKHCPNNHIEKLAAGDALDKLLPLISIPWYDPDTMSRIIAFAKHLVAKVPVYEMSFKPDRSAVDFFWQFQKTLS